MTMLAIQSAKKDLRRRIREILKQIPADSVVAQCQLYLERYIYIGG